MRDRTFAAASGPSGVADATWFPASTSSFDAAGSAVSVDRSGTPGFAGDGALTFFCFGI